MSQNQANDEGAIVALLLLIIGGISAIAGGIYSFSTWMSTTFGDCPQTYQENVLLDGFRLLFTPGQAPAFAEGLKLTAWTLMFLGVAILLGRWVWNRRTTSYSTIATTRSAGLGGKSLVAGVILTVIGISGVLWVRSATQQACVAGWF